MSLLIINEQTTLHIIFYVKFVFLVKKKTSDYIWIMKQIKTLHMSLNFFASMMLIIDYKRDLIIVIHQVFSRSIINHLLCFWHIDNNVMINCKKQFVIIQTWKKFFVTWNKMMYAFVKFEYEITWNVINDKYNVDLKTSKCMIYLWKIYL